MVGLVRSKVSRFHLYWARQLILTHNTRHAHYLLDPCDSQYNRLSCIRRLNQFTRGRNQPAPALLAEQKLLTYMACLEPSNTSHQHDDTASSGPLTFCSTPLGRQHRMQSMWNAMRTSLQQQSIYTRGLVSEQKPRDCCFHSSEERDMLCSA